MAERAKDPRLQALYDAGMQVYSFSKLNTIHQCLYSAYLTYIQHQRGVGSCYTELGSSCHQAIEDMFAGTATQADLLPALQQSLKDIELLGLDFPKDFKGGDSIRQRWVADMQHLCKTFYLPKGTYTIEELLILHVDPTRAIQGYSDLLKWNDDGSVIVLDLKTSSNYPNDDLLEHGRQLTIYGMALEQAGHKVRGTAWIMLKYVVLQFSWYATARSKTKSNLVRIVNRSKIYATLQKPVLAACKDAGMDETEIEFAMQEFQQTNILGPRFPASVRRQFSIKPYVRWYPYTQELKNEALSYINRTADLYETMLQDTSTPWPPCKIDKTNSFFCSNLCNHRKTCRYIADYMAEFQPGKNKENSDDALF